MFSFTQELPLYSEDYTLINKINYSKYIETENNLFGSYGSWIEALINDPGLENATLLFAKSKLVAKIIIM